MRAIEMETVIPQDGKLPAAFGEAFGRKVRVIILLEDEELHASEMQNTSGLMGLAGQIKAFEDIADPVDYQRALRDEWADDWEERCQTDS